MAITAAQLQAELGVKAGDPRVLRASEVEGADATKQGWLVEGRGTVAGRTRWVVCTASDNAAAQAAAVLTGLRA